MKTIFLSMVLLAAVHLCAADKRAVPAPKSDDEVEALSESVASSVRESGKKKITVLDFTDLQGAPNELGRFVAEQMSVNLVMHRKDFSVMDRANMKSILAEHKLTVAGLVDPATAKKFAQFAGVDALVLGSITPLKDEVLITTKVVATDTAEIIGAGKGRLTKTPEIQQLLASGIKTDDSIPKTEPAKPEVKKISQKFGDLVVEFESLRILDDSRALLTLTFKNSNARRTIYAALGTDLGGTLNSSLLDDQGHELKTTSSEVSGLAAKAYQHEGFFSPTQLEAGETMTTTIKYHSGNYSRIPSAQSYRLQAQILVGTSYDGSWGPARPYNLMVDLTQQQ